MSAADFNTTFHNEAIADIAGILREEMSELEIPAEVSKYAEAWSTCIIRAVAHHKIRHISLT